MYQAKKRAGMCQAKLDQVYVKIHWTRYVSK